MIKLTDEIYVRKELIEAVEIVLLNPESFPGAPMNYQEQKIGYYVIVHLKQNNNYPGGQVMRNYLFNPQLSLIHI